VNNVTGPLVAVVLLLVLLVWRPALASLVPVSRSSSGTSARWTSRGSGPHGSSWDCLRRRRCDGLFHQFIGLEQGARCIRAYQPVVIHRLLQTSAYATAGRCSFDRR
jgi:hypothetical protein